MLGGVWRGLQVLDSLLPLTSMQLLFMLIAFVVVVVLAVAFVAAVVLPVAVLALSQCKE